MSRCDLRLQEGQARIQASPPDVSTGISSLGMIRGDSIVGVPTILKVGFLTLFDDAEF